MADAPPMLRRARPDEAAAITALMLRSKGSWGYPDAFMSQVASDMAIAPEAMETDLVEVAEKDGAIIAVMRLQRRADHAWLQDLFVDPRAMGQGLGRHLFERATAYAREWGYREMCFDSDPNAEPFYRRMGAERVGMPRSTLVTGRELPRLCYRI